MPDRHTVIDTTVEEILAAHAAGKGDMWCNFELTAGTRSLTEWEDRTNAALQGHDISVRFHTNAGYAPWSWGWIVIHECAGAR